jgi:hypothetical protein
MSLINERPAKLKPCYTFGCDTLVWTQSSPKRCQKCLEKIAAAKPATRPYTHRHRPLGESDSDAAMSTPEAIAAVEAAFAAALKEIRARPRPEPELRYQSSLHGLKGTGL